MAGAEKGFSELARIRLRDAVETKAWLRQKGISVKDYLLL